MGVDKGESLLKKSAKLRHLAEEQLKREMFDPDFLRNNPEPLRLFHELQVHQIELEMQNVELRQARAAMEVELGRCTGLYDFSPVGYITLDCQGAVLSANLTAAALLGIECARLIGQRFGMYVAYQDRQQFSEFLKTVFTSKIKESCETLLTIAGKSKLFVQIDAISSEDGQTCRVAVLDITGRKRAEQELQSLHDGLELMVRERTLELTMANEQLTHEIDERRRAEESLHVSYGEIQSLKDLLQAENIYLQQVVSKKHNFGEIVGQSKSLSSVFVRIQQVAPMNATVLLLGETGTGKGVVARAIHSRSARKGRAMITVNCTALPMNLIESELFGRERGAFTGASERQIGRFELADGGTIFLDEIGEMPMDLQCKLLRVIQDGEFERLGSPRTIKVDVRVIAATNRSLDEEIRCGRFREDLFYRLNVFPITIPPLRLRKDDIPLLVNHFVAKFNKKNCKSITTVSKETLKVLQEYHWPGNVRELESVIERAVIISQGATLQLLDFLELTPKTGDAAGQGVKSLVEMEHDHILQVLQKTNWRIDGNKGAAKILGINPSTLRARMRKSGIARQ